MTTLLDVDAVLALLRARCEALGSQQAFAERYDLSKQYVSDVLTRRREPGAKILAALKVDRVTRYALRSA